MIEYQGEFVDVHGIQYTNPVIVINHAYQSVSKNNSVNAIINGDDVTYEVGAGGSTLSLHFNAVLYRDINAMRDGRHSMPLKDRNGSNHFNVPLQHELTVAEIVPACESWLMNNVFNGEV